jgi:hypothetical protein
VQSTASGLGDREVETCVAKVIETIAFPSAPDGGAITVNYPFTLVPSTDNYGSITFDAELELYEKAGIPAPAVLQIATIVPARVMKDDKEYGSVAVGKVADLFTVNGKPAEHVSDVRKVEQVIRAGRLYDAGFAHGHRLASAMTAPRTDLTIRQ